MPRALTSAVAVSFLVLAIATQVVFDRVHAAQRANVQPPRTHIALALIEKSVLGFRNFAADLFWLEVIQNLSGWDGKNIRLVQNFEIVSRLDPRFAYPYTFAALILPNYGFLEEATRIAQRGMRALPDNWQIPFYLGAQYHIVGKENAKAAMYLERAAANPKSPAQVKTMYAIYKAGAGDFVAARLLMATIFETSENEGTKALAKEWLERITMLEALQKAVYAYHDTFGMFPRSVDDLIRSRIVRALPPVLKNLHLIIDAEGQVQITR